MYNYLSLLQTKTSSLFLSKTFVLFQLIIKSYRPEDRREKVSAGSDGSAVFRPLMPRLKLCIKIVAKGPDEKRHPNHPAHLPTVTDSPAPQGEFHLASS